MARPRALLAQRRAFWRVIAQGVVVAEKAGQGVGLDRGIGSRWFREAGGWVDPGEGFRLAEYDDASPAIDDSMVEVCSTLRVSNSTWEAGTPSRVLSSTYAAMCGRYFPAWAHRIDFDEPSDGPSSSPQFRRGGAVGYCRRVVHHAGVGASRDGSRGAGGTGAPSGQPR
jgi:hypothetical protein